MLENRINDPQTVDREHLDEVLSRGVNPTIQFSKPGYSRSLLQDINKLCADYGDQLEVRFYGHYSDDFDASVVRHLPDAQWLSIDSLQRVTNEAEISRAPNLRKLSFGVYEFDNPAFLTTLKLAQLTRLVLSDNKKKNFDLSPLAQCIELEELYVNGHTKNIHELSQLPNLRRLSLGSIAKRQTLEFLNGIPNLEKLTLILGGRENINELAHTRLRELEVLRVRGINDLGDLSRFPQLRRLLVEDQLQLQTITFSELDLEEVLINNCKNLTHLDGLLGLQKLRSFRTSRTGLDLDSLLVASWPKTMETVALYSGSQKWNERARGILDQQGYKEYSSK